MKKKTKNAIIRDVRLGIEDHGFLTAWLMLEYGDGSGQGFGGYALSAFTPNEKESRGRAFCGDFILGCLQAGGGTS